MLGKSTRSFPERITKCSTHGCGSSAEGWLIAPDGDPIPGVSCKKCADLCIGEYRDKLKERWTFNHGYVYRTSGNTVRSIEKMPDWGTPRPQCEMEKDCAETVTHLDNSGYIYCTAHGIQRRRYQPCRKLRAHELRRIERGDTVKTY